MVRAERSVNSQLQRYWDDIRNTPPAVSLLQITLFHSKLDKEFAALAMHLLENRVNPNQRIFCISPLKFPFQTGWVDEDCFYAIMRLTDRRLLNEFNPNSNRALIHLLVRQRNYEAPLMLSFLLELGADPNLQVRDKWSEPAFNNFLLNHCTKLSHLLLERGTDINLIDAGGFDAALTAANFGEFTFLSTLNSKRGIYPVNWQRRNTQIEYVKPPFVGMNGLHLAASGGHLGAVTFYLDTKHLDINSISEFGYTALHFAADAGRGAVVSNLCTNGAQVNLKNNSGDLPLHLAVKRNRFTSAELLRYGSEQTTGADGMTPYILARSLSCDIKLIGVYFVQTSKCQEQNSLQILRRSKEVYCTS
jgi:ankyrin repeat protein